MQVKVKNNPKTIDVIALIPSSALSDCSSIVRRLYEPTAGQRRYIIGATNLQHANIVRVRPRGHLIICAISIVCGEVPKGLHVVFLEHIVLFLQSAPSHLLAQPLPRIILGGLLDFFRRHAPEV